MIDVTIQKKIKGVPYKLEVYSNDGNSFRVCKDYEDYQEYQTSRELYEDYPWLARVILA